MLNTTKIADVVVSFKLPDPDIDPDNYAIEVDYEVTKKDGTVVQTQGKINGALGADIAMLSMFVALDLQAQGINVMGDNAPETDN